MIARTCLIIAGLLSLLSGALLAADVSPENPVGWRGNWTGRFPDCTPPVTWSRRCTSPVSEIRYSARKPVGQDASSAVKPTGQSIVHWLTAGPFTPKNPAQALEEETVPNESALSPDDGDALSSTTWVRFDKKSIAELSEEVGPTDDVVDNLDFERVYSKETIAALPGGQGVAYAHAYLFSPRAGTIALLLNHANGLKLWLNGNAIYSHPEAIVSGCVNHYDFARFDWHWGPTQTVNLKLEKGWNRLLCKSVRGDKGWSINLRMTAPAGATYESQNIAWEAHLPSRGYSCPIVVGDRIFLTAEVDDLICIDKKDGHILWRRSNNFYDAATPEERAQNPLWATLEPINAKLQTTASYPENLALHHQMQDVVLQIDKIKFNWGDPRFGPVQGNAVPTPCSDGQHVYVYFSSGLAACYDLEGHRVWIRSNRDLGNIGGYNTQSPAIVDGVMVIYRNQVRGIDAKTGEIRWTSQPSKEDERAQCVVPALVGGERIVIAHHNHYFRAKDGQPMGGGSAVHHATAVLTENNTVINCMDSCFGRWRLIGSDGNSITTEGLPGAGSPFQGAYNIASPLYDQGFVYLMNINGNFIVWQATDTATKVAYSVKRLDAMHPIIQPWNWNIGYTVSPMLGGKHVYVMDNQATTVVLQPGAAFKPIAVNTIENYLPRQWITNTQENTYSTPVCDGSTLYIRGDETLYCIRGISALCDMDSSDGEAPLTVKFNARESTSGNGNIISYAWDFGDKTTAEGATTEHSYSIPGRYVARLTVKDSSGATNSTEARIHVLPPDTTPPAVTGVVAGLKTKIVVTFSKPIDRASAENPAHYTLAPAIGIASAKLGTDPRTVTLLTQDLLVDGVSYALAFNHIVDCARKPNPLPAETHAGFQTTALVAHWKMNEGNGKTLADSSGFANHAVIKAEDPAWSSSAAGHPGSLIFNGRDICAETDTCFQELSNPFSVAVWVNPADSQAEWADILGNHGGQFTGFVLQQDNASTNLYSFGLGDGKKWSGVGSVQLEGNKWQHLTAVCDGKIAVLYLNGIEKARGETSSILAPNLDLNFRIGQGFATGRFFRGSIKDVRIYAKALSSREVLDVATVSTDAK